MLTINDNNARYVIIDSSLEDTEEIAMEDNVLVLPLMARRYMR